MLYCYRTILNIFQHRVSSNYQLVQTIFLNSPSERYRNFGRACNSGQTLVVFVFLIKKLKVESVLMVVFFQEMNNQVCLEWMQLKGGNGFNWKYVFPSIVVCVDVKRVRPCFAPSSMGCISDRLSTCIVLKHAIGGNHKFYIVIKQLSSNFHI